MFCLSRWLHCNGYNKMAPHFPAFHNIQSAYVEKRKLLSASTCNVYYLYKITENHNRINNYVLLYILSLIL